MNNIKRISLMTAIFLTVALASSAVEAGVIPINGPRRERKSHAFSQSSGRDLFNGSVMSTDTALGPFTVFYSLPVDFAFANTPPGNPGGSRLIVGDAANGDSILACFLGINSGLWTTAIIAIWIPGPLSAERAGTLALEAASPRTNAQTL